MPLTSSRRASSPQGFKPLPIAIEHAECVGDLPPHHRNPFDRMLVAQAQVEGLLLATGNEQLRRYDVAFLVATER